MFDRGQNSRADVKLAHEQSLPYDNRRQTSIITVSTLALQDMDSFVESGDEKFEEDIEEEMHLKMLSPGIKKVVMHLIAEDNVRK